MLELLALAGFVVVLELRLVRGGGTVVRRDVEAQADPCWLLLLILRLALGLLRLGLVLWWRGLGWVCHSFGGCWAWAVEGESSGAAPGDGGSAKNAGED